MVGRIKRKRKSTNKYRGHRTFGWGNTKNHRGSGCTGGMGRAGSNKHKFSKYWMDFGKHGFNNPTSREYDCINIDDVVEMMKNGQLGKNGKVDLTEAGYGKLLGRGSFKGVKASISVDSASASAQKKAQESGVELIVKNQPEAAGEKKE